ncbi:MAG: hypothetical protein ACKO27_02940 [Ilumatobacteraceae bacterium]
MPLRLVDDLVGALAPDAAAEVHARVARHLITQGSSRLVDALSHARAAGGDEVVEEIADIADHAGRMSLSIGDYASADSLLELADEAGSDDSLVVRAERLGQRGRALEGLGLVNEAREVLARIRPRRQGWRCRSCRRPRRRLGVPCRLVRQRCPRHGAAAASRRAAADR